MENKLKIISISGYSRKEVQTNWHLWRRRKYKVVHFPWMKYKETQIILERPPYNTWILLEAPLRFIMFFMFFMLLFYTWLVTYHFSSIYTYMCTSFSYLKSTPIYELFSHSLSFRTSFPIKEFFIILKFISFLKIKDSRDDFIHSPCWPPLVWGLRK